MGLPKPKKAKKQCHVYLIADPIRGVCKIGYSVSPKRRLKSIQTGYPFDLYLLATIQGDARVERFLYERHASNRIRQQGEWFQLTQPICQDFGISWDKLRQFVSGGLKVWKS